MKLFSLVLILFSFFMAFADNVVCAGHDSYKAESVTSFVKDSETNSQNAQTDFSPFDHCEICPGSCNVNVAFTANLNGGLFFASPMLSNIFFTYKGLRLNSFPSNGERPPIFV